MLVPKDLRLWYNCSEIKRSLKTGDERLAIRKAQVFALQLELDFRRRRTMEDDVSRLAKLNPLNMLGLEIERLELGNGQINIHGLKTDPNQPENELKMLEALRSMLVGQNINNLPPGITFTPAETATRSLLISEVAELFISEQLQTEAWRQTTADENRQIYQLLIRITGDIPMNTTTSDIARDVKTVLMSLPSNMNKKPEFRNKTIEQIRKMSVTDKLSTKSINKYLERVSAFFSWAVSNHYATTNPFSTLKLRTNRKDQKKAMDERAPLSSADLTTYFSTDLFAHHKHHGEPHRFWLPLLALFSGARLNELASLCIEDVVQDNGIWVLDINENGPDKKLKTPSSVRLIPVHSELIALGFLKYVQSVKKPKSGRAWIFPEIESHAKGRSYNPSKFFTHYRKKFGWVNSTPKKDFHSFRHTVADFLKQHNVQESIAASILGHYMPNITYGRYGSAYLAQTLKPAIDSLSFPQVTSVVKPW